MNSDPTVAVVGATGAAGGTVLEVLHERNFPVGQLRVYASERSAGKRLVTPVYELIVSAVHDDGLRECDVVFFAAGAQTSREHAPIVAEAGGIAIDKSSAFRMDERVPLVVPEVNAETLSAHHGIVANPNCVAVPLCIAVAPLHREFGLRHITVATYQSASGAGKALMNELIDQEFALFKGEVVKAEVYPHVLHGNVVPGGWAMEGDETEEEVKVRAETRRVLGLPELPISVTTVRVPVLVGHAMAVWVELEHEASADDARRVLEDAPGVVVVDDPSIQLYPTPRDTEGTDAVWVGRIRADRGRERGLAMFVAADNLRKGAATNAVQIAELLIG